MMSRYGTLESSKTKSAFADPDIVSRNCTKLQKSINPSTKYYEDVISSCKVFTDNKIDVIGKFSEVMLSYPQMLHLLVSLCNYVLKIEGPDIETKLRSSSLLRLYTCFQSCSSLKVEGTKNTHFYLWLYKIAEETDVIRQSAVIDILETLPRLNTDLIRSLKAGNLFREDIIRAKEILKNNFQCSMKAVVIGIVMRGRGERFALDFNEDEVGDLTEQSIQNNNLRKNWFKQKEANTWCKFYKNNDTKHEKFKYGQINYFFRFSHLKEDGYVSNLAIASVTTRNTINKYRIKSGTAISGQNVITDLPLDDRNQSSAASIDINYLYVPLREFVSTSVAIAAVDIEQKPIVSPSHKNQHLLHKDARKFLSNRLPMQIHELFLIDLHPSRRNLLTAIDTEEYDDNHDVENDSDSEVDED